MDRIRVKKFRNIEDLDLSFKTFNCIIGQNYSGKSNFVKLLGLVRSGEVMGDSSIFLEGVEYPLCNGRVIDNWFIYGGGSNNNNIGLNEDFSNISRILWGIYKSENWFYFKRWVNLVIGDIGFDINQDLESINITKKGIGYSDFSNSEKKIINLAVLFLQPIRPGLIVIDDICNNISPNNIGYLYSIIHSFLSFRGNIDKCKVIVTTSSPIFIDKCEDNYNSDSDLIINNCLLFNGKCIYEPISFEGLREWLSMYTLSEIWERDILKPSI